MFIEERLLEKVAYGTEFGPEFSTLIKTLANGHERRKQQWEQPLGAGSVIYNTLRPQDRDHVMRAFYVCAGRAFGFRFKDPLDHTAVNELIGEGNGDTQTLQLKKNYRYGSTVRTKIISKPVFGKVVVKVEGVVTPATVDYVAGTVTLYAEMGADITWSGEFDKPVRFDIDHLPWSVDTKAGGEIRLASTNAAIREIRV